MVFPWRGMQSPAPRLQDELLVLNSYSLHGCSCQCPHLLLVLVCLEQKLLNSWRNFSALSICSSKDIKWLQSTRDKSSARFWHRAVKWRAGCIGYRVPLVLWSCLIASFIERLLSGNPDLLPQTLQLKTGRKKCFMGPNFPKLLGMTSSVR